jgi:putative addiction module CopG family antidote
VVLVIEKSSQLTITVTPELDAFIRERVASGRFDTARDVVRETLKLLETREHGETFFAELQQKRSSSTQ